MISALILSTIVASARSIDIKKVTKAIQNKSNFNKNDKYV